MQYELVNVTGVRDEPFTAELVIEGDELFQSLVGVFEDSDEGNIAPGVSVYNVWPDEYKRTGQTIDRDPAEDAEPVYTPQLV